MEELTLFRAITTGVCGTLDLAKGLGNAFSVLSRVVPLDELRMNVLDTKMHSVKTIATADSNGEKNMLATPLVMPMPQTVEDELRGKTLADVRIVNRIAQDPASSSVRASFFAEVPESSLLIMRLLLDGRRQGSLVLRAVGQDRYTEAQRAIMAGLNEPFAIALNNALAHHDLARLRDRLEAENRYLSTETRVATDDIVGGSFGLAEVMRLVDSVARLDSPVLLLGETGVGKEVIADAIHDTSPRRDGPFVKINCGAIPPALVDSELFGHEKGAFTGATAQKKGRFELAHGGTLFLDEIGELPADVQVRLLRVLQTSTVQRVGGADTVEIDVRIVAATHRNLEQLVAEGTFREDLWYRINVFPIRIPPVRERRSDIPALVHHFVEKKALEMGVISTPHLEPGTMEWLQQYRWPGNVRELENAVERALILCRGGRLSFTWLESLEVPSQHAPSDSHVMPLDTVVAAHIRLALGKTSGVVEGPNGAAALLQTNPSTLRHKMRRLGVPFGRET
ncbi:MAG: sigma 54-interacting transcriptional regulator [Spirochaeta sp.]|nr:sigma 54-interacting transcriptional regulator [Spirochaeta sp.]